MLKYLQIRNLRAITSLEVEPFGQLNLFVGRNNVGKTTLLEALFFLVGASNPRLPIHTNAFARGLKAFANSIWPTYFHALNTEEPITITARNTEQFGEKSLTIRPLLDRTLDLQHQMDSSLSFTTDSHASLSPMGLIFEYRDVNFPGGLVSTISFEGNELKVEGYRELPFRGIFVSPLTEFDWKERFDAIQRKKRVPDLIELLHTVEPRLSDLRLNATGFVEADLGFSSLVPVQLFGGGTARLLSIAMAALDSQKGIVLIDEIDYGLHHSLQTRVWEVLSTWATELGFQLFATTHSYESVRAFADCAKRSLFLDAKLFRLERRDDYFRPVVFTPDEVDEFVMERWELR